MKCPHCLKIISKTISEKNRYNRKNYIYNILDNITDVNTTFKNLYLKGKKFSKKTLIRDLKELQSAGLIKLQKINKKSGGFKYKIYKKRFTDAI